MFLISVLIRKRINTLMTFDVTFKKKLYIPPPIKKRNPPLEKT